MPQASHRLSSVAALLLSACCLTAQADTFNLNLNGTVANASTNAFDWNGTHYDVWRLALDGLDANSSITVTQGDFIEVTINLDTPLTVPGSGLLTWYDVGFGGSGFPTGPTSTDHGTLDLKLAGTSVLGGADTNCHTEGSLLNCRTFSAPDNGPLTIDQAIFKFEITALSAPATLDQASFSYTLFSNAAPVPEPTPALLLGAGLGLLALRRRQSN